MGGFKHGGDVVSKEKLIAKLDNAVALEEGATKVLTENLMVRIEKSSLSEDKKRRLQEIANTLKEDSIRHTMAIREAIEYIQGGDDEF
jgi:hypothetical protein